MVRPAVHRESAFAPHRALLTAAEVPVGPVHLAQPRLVRVRDRRNPVCQVWAEAALAVSGSVDYCHPQYLAPRALVVVGDNSGCLPHHQVPELAAPGSCSWHRVLVGLELDHCHPVDHPQIRHQADL